MRRIFGGKKVGNIVSEILEHLLYCSIYWWIDSRGCDTIIVQAKCNLTWVHALHVLEHHETVSHDIKNECPYQLWMRICCCHTESLDVQDSQYLGSSHFMFQLVRNILLCCQCTFSYKFPLLTMYSKNLKEVWNLKPGLFCTILLF